MKVSDYIVDFLIRNGVTDVFGYPGGMVTHLMDSFSKRESEIRAHVNYHEQGAAFAACGYAQTSGRIGVAYATSGPGATNLITGIANAWFDSIPVLFITGQVNTFESKGKLPIRQRGFQETDIVSMVAGITKYCSYVSDAADIRYELERAVHEAQNGRKGPALLDIPMDIQRKDVDPEKLCQFEPVHEQKKFITFELICDFNDDLQKSRKPILLVGSGVKSSGTVKSVKRLAVKWNIPVVSSMPAFDIFSRTDGNYMGFIGAYGDRTANFAVAKSDFVIALGSRLDIRQVGAVRSNFAPNARIVRVDIDSGEMSQKIRGNDLLIQLDISDFISIVEEKKIMPCPNANWLEICNIIKGKIKGYDDSLPQKFVRCLSRKLPEDIIVTTDVGQNQVWIAQSFMIKNNQRVLFSAGLGAMGYALPAAVGAYYGSGGKKIVCFCGDGGLQMNIQELQFIVRERIPILIIVLNNESLGMIRHFQEMYFDGRYCQTKPEGGYSTPDFSAIANAYGIRGVRAEVGKTFFEETGYEERFRNLGIDDSLECFSIDNSPVLLEIVMKEDTYVFPKLEYGKPNQDQEPLLERGLYQYLMELGEDDFEDDMVRGGYNFPIISQLLSVEKLRTAA